ncbi:MAG: DUF3108 domain-containing protein [Opitutaceae bacterium]
MRNPSHFRANGRFFLPFRSHGCAFAGVLIALGSLTLTATEPALQAGEELTYSVRWAVLPGAGQIRIAAAEAVAGGSPQLNITTSTETRGLARALLTFQARSESICDIRTGHLVALHERSVTRNKRTEYSVDFDYTNRRALFTEKAVPRPLDLPDGDPADLITTLMKTRLWDLEVGDTRDVLVSYRHEFYELTVHAIKMEQVKTPLGEFETIVLEPRMEKTPPKGMFKRGANVRVWVSRDEARLPVRFQVEFKIGTGVATLVKYQPPAATADARFAARE